MNDFNNLAEILLVAAHTRATQEAEVFTKRRTRELVLKMLEELKAAVLARAPEETAEVIKDAASQS